MPLRPPQMDLPASRPAISSFYMKAYNASQQKRYANGYGAGPQSPGQVGPQPGQPEDSAVDATDKKSTQTTDWGPMLVKMFESAATTVVSLFVLG